MKNLSRAAISALFAMGLLVVQAVPASAAPASDLTQNITAGTLAVDILDASRAAVTSPSISLSAKSFSFNCQSGGSASTGTLGSNTQRLYAINPGATTPNGWNITIAATSGATATWSNTGATKKFDFNDSGTSGCSDSADTDTYAGQLSLDPSVATLTTDCATCTTTGVTKGSSASFIEGTADSLTLLAASSSASNPFRGYLTGVGVSQTIPAEQQPDSTYSLNLTMTITAL